MFSIVNQIFVSFIRNDDQIAFDRKRGDLFRLGASKDDTAGILRRVVVDAPRIWR